MNIKLRPPVKYLWRDGYKVFIDSIATFNRYLSQPFGVNWVANDLYRNMGLLGHDGIDIAVPVGQPVYAAHDGIVVEVDDRDDSDGLGIAINDPVQNIQTWYWHNSKNNTRIGENVKAGDLIAYSGGSGKAYGPHLHFQLLQIDDTGRIINRDNGFRGGIDPMPFFYMPVSNPKNMEKEFIVDMYLFYFGRIPNEEEATFWLGKNYKDLLKAMLKDKLSLFNSDN